MHPKWIFKKIRMYLLQEQRSCDSMWHCCGASDNVTCSLALLHLGHTCVPGAHHVTDTTVA